jgi:cytochrome P450
MISLLIGFCVIVVAYFWLTKRRKNFPPGPTPLPVIGIAHHIGATRHPHNVFRAWSKKYGPILGLKLGRNEAIVLDDYKLIKEAFNNPNISGRPDLRAFNEFAGGKNGVLCSDGDVWLEQRRFTLRHLRDFGFGKNHMESLIMDEVVEMIEGFKKEEGQPIAPKGRFNLAILNAIWVILTGNRNSHDDKRVSSILKELFVQFNESSANGLTLFFPELIWLAPEWSGFNKLKRAIDNSVVLFREIIAEHEKTLQEDNPRDFIDSYIIETRKTTDVGSSFLKQMGDKHLLAIIGDLFAAGAETTATTLSWTMLYLTTYPEVQKKLQAEIDRVIGKSRLPTLADKAAMPYTEAVMYEVLRRSSIVALGLFHIPTIDIQFHGYDIPKDTLIVPNLYSVHHNPDVWGDPENFRPERFLSPDGKTVQKHESLMAFSTGKRACLGETLARDEFFLFLTSIFQKFHVELDAASKKTTLEPQIGFLLAPAEFHVVMRDRLH